MESNMSASLIWSNPVIPKSQLPSPTKIGISAAGKKINATGKLVDNAISNLLERLNWMSHPLNKSQHFSYKRPSEI